MTVSIIASTQQLGNTYFVMANLLLSSVWSSVSISTLQTDLSKALAKYFNIAIGHVHVITHIVNSGMAIEAGQEVTW